MVLARNSEGKWEICPVPYKKWSTTVTLASVSTIFAKICFNKEVEPVNKKLLLYFIAWFNKFSTDFEVFQNKFVKVSCSGGVVGIIQGPSPPYRVSPPSYQSPPARIESPPI